MPLHPTTYARINLSALIHNYRRIAADAQTDVLCIVKADGYGHGAIPCAKALYGAGARWFGVANPTEAIQLRKGLEARDAHILILGYTSPEDVPALIEESITQTVYSEEYAVELLRHIPDGARLTVHFKLDTGMNRLGFPTRPASRHETVEAIARLSREPKLLADGIFTHFACADEPESSMTDEQWLEFSETVQALSRCGVSFPTVHACNSAGIYRMPAAHASLVRAGIILYGIMPSNEVSIDGLMPVMSLHTHVTHVHRVHAGEAIGYGASFHATQDMQIATLAIGYADGLIRAYGNGGVRIGGKECALVGRICMDQCMADVTGMDVRSGDEAVFFDESRQVTKLSYSAGMIPYETVCLIGKRVPRIYCEETSV